MLHVIINQAVGLQVDGTDTVDHGFFAVLHAKHLDGRPLNELQAGGANHEAGNGSGGGPGSAANMTAFTDLANLLKDRAITQQEYAALLVGHCWLLAGFARTHVTPPIPPPSRAQTQLIAREVMESKEAEGKLLAAETQAATQEGDEYAPFRTGAVPASGRGRRAGPKVAPMRTQRRRKVQELTLVVFV
jgi:hypothetical protein